MNKKYFDTNLPDLLKMKSTKADSARIMVLEDALRACDEYFKAGLVYSQHADEWTEAEAAEQDGLMQKLADVAGQKTIAALRIEAKPSKLIQLPVGPA